MSNRHNTGPWEYENVQNKREQTAYGVVRDAAGKILFDTLNTDVAEIHTERDEYGFHRRDSVAEANLTLAAAAPDLLAACELAARHCPQPEVVAFLEAALKKARGKVS